MPDQPPKDRPAGPKVSVLMNCYNGARFLEQGIRSVLAQTFTDFELVIWDNRSGDDSAAIVRRFSDPRIHYHLAPRHTTLALARRQAFGLLNGEWIGILDVDDLWRPDKLQRQVALAESHPEAGFIYCATAIVAEQGAAYHDLPFGRITRKLPEGDIYARLLRGNFISVASLLIHRQRLAELGGFSGRYPIMEDYWTTLNLARRHPAYAVQEVLCDYRVHGSNASRIGPLDTFEDLRIIRELFPEPRAVLASQRIILRHLKKCIRHRRLPQFADLGRALTHQQT
jgi:glycosyltransferase involved in cell wall biosynthesis